MIAVRTALAMVMLACWDAWRLLAARIDDATTAALVLALVGVIAWRFAVSRAPVPTGLIVVALLGYALACMTGPALLQIGAAAGALVLVGFRGSGLPRLPIAGLAVLLLPVLPTLDFLLAYPLRRASAAITVALLRMNGVEVTLNGIALEWQGQSLLFDGPCSGVRMLWAALVLASIAALVGRHRPPAYARTLAVATFIAVAGNALRAASLFYLENGYVDRLQGPVAHQAVGVLAFVMVAVAVLALPQVQRPA
ncbi:MAG: archaeosortase/exosortase family protein [Pseudomonadota bacterium]